MKINSNSVRGTRDILPLEQQTREWVRSVILNTYKSFGFNQIKTPIIEDINLLTKGDSGDNTKLMFKVLKRGEKLNLETAKTESDLTDLGLRYDLTVPLARFYANNQNNLLTPFKSIQIDDAFRAERPQKGRLRQFTQCDIDVLGDESVNADIEVIYVSALTLLNLGFANFKYKISDRRILNSLIVSCGFNAQDCTEICICLDKADKIGIDGVKEELISKGFEQGCVNKLATAVNEIVENGINALNNFEIDKQAVENVSTIVNTLNQLSQQKFSAEFDISIVRGQGYYTSSVFEVFLDGYNGACGGGGRYDNMIGNFTGNKTCAVGFSLGFERLCMLLAENNNTEFKPKLALIYFADNNFSEVMKKVVSLQQQFDVFAVKKQKNFSFQLEKLKSMGYKQFMFFDSEEIKSI